MIMGDNLEKSLKQLTEEYIVSLELSLHDKISSLSHKICASLVEYYEDHLENELYTSDSIQKAELKVIKYITEKLKKHAIIASAYSDIIEFVGIQDLLCLSSLVRAVPEGNKESLQTDGSQFVNFAKQEAILRKSIYLLRYINLREKLEYDDQELWLERVKLERLNSTGFPVTLIDIKNGSLLEMDANRGIKEDLLLFECDDDEGDLKSSKATSSGFFTADWFKRFRERAVEVRYPLDRFSILISIWIVGVESRHKALEQLMSGLVDEIMHEETNNCNEEELMQLTQFGSFWLSHHKRYRVTILETPADQHMEVDEEDDNDDDDDEDEDEDEDYRNSGDALDRLKKDEFLDGRSLVDARFKLRRLIDDELLRGVKCSICDYEPTELLEPINRYSCPSCNGESSSFKHFCSISYRPFPLIGLDVMFTGARKNLRRLVLFDPAEWARQMLSCIRGNEVRESTYELEDEDEDAALEQLDVCEKFERLTMIRGEDKKLTSRSISSSSSSSGGGDESLIASDDQPLDDERKSNLNTPVNEALSIMRTSMKVRLMRINDEQKTSESIKILKFTSSQDNNVNECIPVFAPDLLLLDSFGGLLKVRLVSSDETLSTGTIWSCMERAERSELLLGCTRLFSSLELIQLGQSNETYFTCPFCDLTLERVMSLSCSLK